MKGIVAFYEKPGCEENEAQKEKLKQADYMLQVVDMINKKWQMEELCKFFVKQNVHDCVNPLAAPIVSGELDPSCLSSEELMGAMVENPDLIMSPLFFFRGEFGVGSHSDLAVRLLG
jgi:arsenate reductase-like glutaredoxin family protein